MSWPAKNTRPLSGAISPVNSPISVVFPAPFGPMIACNSRGATAIGMLSEATMPPKCLVRSSVRRSASATAASLQQSVDAAAGIEHDQQKKRPEHDLPIFRSPRGAGAENRGAQALDQQRQAFLEHE